MTTNTAVLPTVAYAPAPVTLGTRVEIIPGGFSGDQGHIVDESYGRYLVETDSHLLTGYYRAEQLQAVTQ
jgi:hypothetical protein